MQCIHQVSMLLAEEGDEANAATATACPNLRPTNRPPVAAVQKVQTLPRKAQEHEAVGSDSATKSTGPQGKPSKLEHAPPKNLVSPPSPPCTGYRYMSLPVQNNSCRFVNLLIHMDTKGDEGSVDEVRTSVGR